MIYELFTSIFHVNISLGNEKKNREGSRCTWVSRLDPPCKTLSNLDPPRAKHSQMCKYISSCYATAVCNIKFVQPYLNVIRYWVLYMPSSVCPFYSLDQNFGSKLWVLVICYCKFTCNIVKTGFWIYIVYKYISVNTEPHIFMQPCVIQWNCQREPQRQKPESKTDFKW